jgi:putative toxin-antitoxin system antitoxin component (TIGR02293 family)
MIIEQKQRTTRRYKKLRNALGKKNIDKEFESSFDFIFQASKGVNADVIKNFAEYFDLSRETTASLLNVSSPTIYRWIRTHKKLDKNLSSKLFEIADLFLYGTEVFGNKENFFKWTELPNTALGGMKPLEIIELSEGVSKVRDVLLRIEYGVFS